MLDVNTKAKQFEINKWMDFLVTGNDVVTIIQLIAG